MLVSVKFAFLAVWSWLKSKMVSKLLASAYSWMISKFKKNTKQSEEGTSKMQDMGSNQDIQPGEGVERGYCGSGCGCSKQAEVQSSSFELYRDSQREYRWRLLARNGRNIATSGEGYANKADAIHAIGLVKLASTDTVIKDITEA